MLTESGLLSMIGGGAGVAAAFGTLHTIVHCIPPNLPRLSEVNVDWRVLAFGGFISVITGLLFGLAPALRLARSALSSAIKEGSRGSGYGVKTGRLRDALIVSELAVAVVLMIGAGLLIRTLQDLLRQDPGFNPTQVVAANVNLPFPSDPKNDPYRTLAKQTTFYRELGHRMHALPGVTLAAFVSHLPATAAGFMFTLGIEGRPSRSEGDLRARDILVSPDYFKVMQTGLVRGRYFTEADEDGKPRVAIVDESTARRYWPGTDALGRRIRMGQGAWMTIVGVIKNMKQDGLDIDGLPHVYVPVYQEFDVSPGYVFRDFVIVLRTALPVSALEPQIRHQVQTLDPRLPVYSIASMNELLDQSIASRRFSADLVGAFAGVALFLASIGIYGLLAYMAAQRSREIGLRVVLGAGRSDILRLIAGRAVVLAAIGIAAGIVIASFIASTMSAVLYGVRPHDPAVFLTVALVLFVVATLAGYGPAWRAAKADPATALRETCTR